VASVIGNYELIDRFAVGGAAEIFRARDQRSGDVVVIKRIRPDIPMTTDTIAAFGREMHIALRAHHKNLVRGIELGSVNGVDYGVFEYVDGQDLEQVLRRAEQARIRLPLSFSLFIVSEILSGLAIAHELVDERGVRMGLVHRDLAPKNIFLRYDGAVRVADFGLGLATAYEPLEDGVVGTAGYLAPEQALRDQLDARTDLYAVGIIAYELISGQRAFSATGKTDEEILKMHQKPVALALPPEVPKTVRDVVSRALSTRKSDRFPTASLFRDALFQCDVKPDESQAPLGLATILRRLFAAEFKSTRLTGNPLPFMST
jgi:eukaryotic-like serine/threonine-protein kinase